MNRSPAERHNVINHANYAGREAGYVPLVYCRKVLAIEAGIRQSSSDISVSATAMEI